MKLTRLLLFSLLILAWCTNVYAQAEDTPKPGPVVLTDGQDKYPLGLHLEILEDPGGELTIDDVASREFESRFVPSQVEAPNYGFTDSVYWVRLNLRNEARLTDRWLLDVGFANMHFVELYTPLADSDGFEMKQTGSMRSPDTRDISHPHIVLTLTIPSQSEQTIYLRFQNGGPMILPLTLWQPNVFADETLDEQMLEGVFFGVVFGLLFYHLFLFFSLREVTYLYLVLLLAGVATYEASQANYLELYLIPSSYQVKQHIIALAVALIMVSVVLLHDTFLTAKKLFPNIYRMDMVLIGVWGVLGALTFLTSYHNLATVMAPMIVLTLSASSLALIVAWPRGFRANRALIIALLGLFASIFFYILGRLAIISNVTITEYLFRIGFVSLAVCWSLALADRVNKLKSETEETNRELQNSERRLSQILEGLPFGIVVYGRDQKPKYINRRVTEILSNPDQGIEPDLSSGRTLDQSMKYYSIRVSGSDQDYPFENMPVYRALQGESASVDDAEADLIDKRIPLEIWASPVRNKAGEIESTVVAIQDISARKQSEMALQASEKKFRVIVENAFDGIVFMARNREVLYVSPSYARLNGMDLEDMIGKSGTSFVHPDDRARIAEVFGELLQRPGGKVTVEYRSRHQNGSWFWVETNAVNLLNDPQVGGVVLNIRDISQRKAMDAELEEHHKHLEFLVEKQTAELSATNEWLSTLNRVRQSVRGTADLPQTYDKLFDSILQMFDAKAVFLLHWDSPGGQIETTYHRRRADSTHAVDGFASIVMNDPTLRKEIESGVPIHLPADRIPSLPASSGQFFREAGIQSFFLMPMIASQSVIGLLGLGMHRPKQEITRAQVELVKTMAIDLVNLAEGAQLLDHAQALVVAEERNSLARELHDSVTQLLFSASMLAEATPRIWDKDQGIARMNLEKLSVLLRGALAEMRSLLFELRSGGPQGQSLDKLLTTLVESVRARTQIDISLKMIDESALPENVIQSFYRITREALNNVIVHSGATRVTISLLNEKQGTELHIQDDGHGFGQLEIPTGHLGIDIMTERATQIGADLQIISKPGQGTEVVITWPGTGGKTG